jgi:hypothetical protein
MSGTENRDLNDSAYHRLKQSIDESHPRGWFVAIDDIQILAAAPTFQELEVTLKLQGKDPREIMVVEAGVDYPESVTIFMR